MWEQRNHNSPKQTWIISYNTIKQYRTNLAKDAMLKSSENNVPLPSHFNKEMFTIAAFDNFDQTDRTSLSGLSSSHDTVFTLFQVKPSEHPCSLYFKLNLQNNCIKIKEKRLQFKEC